MVTSDTITLKQNSVDIGNLPNILNKYGDTEIRLNLEMLDGDLSKFATLESGSKPKSPQKNSYHKIVKHLKRIRDKSDDFGNYQMTWMYKPNEFKVGAYPVSLGFSPALGFTAVDYIEHTGGKLIAVSYADALKLIAFEIMHRDLGCKTSEADKFLSTCSISVSNSSNIAISLIRKYISDDEDIIKLAAMTRILESPYATPDGAMSWDYFGTAYRDGQKAFTDPYYRSAVYRSLDVAVSIILNVILTGFINHNIPFKICGADYENMYFIVNGAVDSDNKHLIFRTATVRIFGRVFEVKPVVNFF